MAILNDAKFIYCDAKGNITIRNVKGISESDVYLQGLCAQTGELRTFRKDRILEFLVDDPDAADYRLNYHVANNPPASPPPRSHHLPDVCFTGFKSEDKARLVQLAESAGLIVRSSVTRNLDFLCGGYNAGPAKIEKARRQGVVFVNESQFAKMLETGEVPEA